MWAVGGAVPWLLSTGHPSPTHVPRSRFQTPGPELETGDFPTEKLLLLFLVAFLVPYFTAPTNGILLLKHYEIPGPVLALCLRNSISAEWGAAPACLSGPVRGSVGGRGRFLGDYPGTPEWRVGVWVTRRSPGTRPHSTPRGPARAPQLGSDAVLPRRPVPAPRGAVSKVVRSLWSGPPHRAPVIRALPVPCAVPRRPSPG